MCAEVEVWGTGEAAHIENEEALFRRAFDSLQMGADLYLGRITGLPSPPDSYTAMAARRYRVYRPGTFCTRRRTCPASLPGICRRTETVNVWLRVIYGCIIDAVNCINFGIYGYSHEHRFQSGNLPNVPAFFCDQAKA